MRDKTATIVKNGSCTNMDMSNSWKNGYSAKGKNRDSGLSCYFLSDWTLYEPFKTKMIFLRGCLLALYICIKR